MGKRGGSTTPAPMWETTSPAPVSMADITGTDAGGKGKEGQGGGVSVSVSARKLAATLWEMNQAGAGPCNKKKKDKFPKLPSQSASLPPHLSDPYSYTPITDVSILFIYFSLIIIILKNKKIKSQRVMSVIRVISRIKFCANLSFSVKYVQLGRVG